MAMQALAKMGLLAAHATCVCSWRRNVLGRFFQALAHPEWCVINSAKRADSLLRLEKGERAAGAGQAQRMQRAIEGVQGSRLSGICVS